MEVRYLRSVNWISRLGMFRAIFIGVILAITRQSASPQGTLYLSNLDVPFLYSVNVGMSNLIAISFETGNAPFGYILNTAQLHLNSPDSIGYVVSVYNDAGGVPGDNLETLVGSGDTLSGIYSYTASSTLLVPSTVYWITATRTESGDVFWWAPVSTNFSSADGWRMNVGDGLYENRGSGWTTRGSPLQFAVYAKAIPEPSTLSFAVLAGVCILCCRKRR